MAERTVKREATRQFVLAGRTVEKGEIVRVSAKVAKYLDGLDACPVKKIVAMKAAAKKK